MSYVSLVTIYMMTRVLTACVNVTDEGNVEWQVWCDTL